MAVKSPRSKRRTRRRAFVRAVDRCDAAILRCLAAVGRGCVRCGRGVARPFLSRRRLGLSLLALLLVLGVGGFFAFNYAPIPVSLVTPRVSASIAERFGPGHTVEIEDAAFERVVGGFVLRLDEVIVHNAEGATLVRVPRAEIAVDRDVLFGDTRPRRVTLIGPSIVMKVGADGGVSLTGDENAPALVDVDATVTGPTAGLASAIRAVDQLLGASGTLGALDQLDIENADLVVDDARIGARERLDDVDVRFRRAAADGGIAMSVGSTDDAQPWLASATVSTRGDGSRYVDLGFENIDIARFGSMAPAGMAPANLGGRLWGHAFLSLAADATPTSAELRLDLKGLRFAYGLDDADTLELDTVKLNALWDPARGALSIEPISVAMGGGGRASLGMRIAAAADDPNILGIEVRGAGILLPGSADGVRQLRLDRLVFRGDYDRTRRVLAIRDASVVGANEGVALSGSFDFSGPTPGMRLGLAGSRMSVDVLKRLWPVNVAREIRGWVVANVLGGTLDDITLSFDVPPGVLGLKPKGEPLLDSAFKASLSFSDGSFRPGPGMPVFRSASGTFEATGRTVTMEVASATSEPVAGAVLAFDGGKLRIEHPTPTEPVADVAFRAVGGAGAVATTLRSLPIVIPGLVAVAPEALSGNVDATVNLRIPLKGPRDGSAITWSTEGTVVDFAGDGVPVLGKLEGGNFKFSVDPQLVAIVGDVKVAGAPAKFELGTEPTPEGLRGAATFSTTFEPSRMRIMPADLKRIEGPVTIKARSPSLGAIDGTEVEIDLAKARYARLGPGLQKASGRPGKVGFVARAVEGGIRLEDFALAAGDTSIKGTLELGADGTVTSGSFPTFRVSEGDDAHAEMTYGGGVAKLEVGGAALDARPFLDKLATKSDEGRDDIDLTVKLGTLIGNNGEALAGANLRYSSRGGQIRALELSGRLGGGRVEGSLAGRDAGTVAVTGEDAGAFFRFLDIYSRLRGGAFELVGGTRLPADGYLAIQDFDVAGEAALGQAMGGGQRGEEATRRGFRFSKARVDFRQEPGRIVVRDGAVWGPDLGATLEGNLDFAADRIEIRGTFVPAYALNNLFAKLPVIGLILGGASNEGLLGVTFLVSGKLSNPNLAINPMSAVAPGFLRKIFEFRDADPRAGTPTPAPTR